MQYLGKMPKSGAATLWMSWVSFNGLAQRLSEKSTRRWLEIGVN